MGIHLDYLQSVPLLSKAGILAMICASLMQRDWGIDTAPIPSASVATNSPHKGMVLERRGPSYNPLLPKKSRIG